MFGITITAIACLEGLSTGARAEQVGRSTTRAVVMSIFLVVIVDLFFYDHVLFLGWPLIRGGNRCTLANARGMVEENRPEVKSTLQHLNTASQKLQPLLEDFRKTSAEANQALGHVDAVVGENRADVRKAVAELRRTLTNMTDVSARADQTLDVNSENIDDLLDNLRQVTANLKEFTATIKTRPYTLIRATNPPEHKTGEQP